MHFLFIIRFYLDVDGVAFLKYEKQCCKFNLAMCAIHFFCSHKILSRDILPLFTLSQPHLLSELNFWFYNMIISSFVFCFFETKEVAFVGILWSHETFSVWLALRRSLGSRVCRECRIIVTHMRVYIALSARIRCYRCVLSR